MKKTYLLGGFLGLLLLVGIGCQSAGREVKNDDPVENDDAIEETIDTSEYSNLFTGDEGGDTLEDEEKKVDDLELTAKPMGDRKVRFDWQVPEELAEKAEAYRFARGTEENPTYPSNWWWERGPAHRELEWEGLPTGPAHFRVCAVVNDECEVYSNDVEIIVE